MRALQSDKLAAHLRYCHTVRRRPPIRAMSLMRCTPRQPTPGWVQQVTAAHDNIVATLWQNALRATLLQYRLQRATQNLEHPRSTAQTTQLCASATLEPPSPPLKRAKAPKPPFCTRLPYHSEGIVASHTSATGTARPYSCCAQAPFTETQSQTSQPQASSSRPTHSTRTARLRNQNPAHADVRDQRQNVILGCTDSRAASR